MLFECHCDTDVAYTGDGISKLFVYLWSIPGTKIVSWDASALFPSVPIREALKHIKELLDEDDTLSSRTKLDPQDVIDLCDLCLSSSNFIYDGRHHTTNDSGPIGLSLMVTVSQLWMNHTIDMGILLKRESALSLRISRFMLMIVGPLFSTHREDQA